VSGSPPRGNRLRARLKIALTIAGSDSGGGAGIEADLKTFAALGVHGAAAIAALTAQNTKGVFGVAPTTPEFLTKQIDAVLDDFCVGAIKIGMLATADNVRAVIGALRRDALFRSDVTRASRAPFVVCDPVLKASSGDALSGDGFLEALRDTLLPRVDLLTPNLAEAARVLGEAEAGDEKAMLRQGEAMLALGPRAVLMKGGHLTSDDAVDWLVTKETKRRFAAKRIASANTHGTGCVLSSAIAARIVLGEELADAIAAAKLFVSESIQRGRDVTLGHRAGPLQPLKLAASSRP